MRKGNRASVSVNGQSGERKQALVAPGCKVPRVSGKLKKMTEFMTGTDFFLQFFDSPIKGLSGAEDAACHSNPHRF